MEGKVSNKRKGQILAGFISGILLIALDQITKYLAVTHLKNTQPFSIISGVFELSYLENRGAAFGILQGKKMFFIIITIVALVVLFYLYIKIPEEKRYFLIRLIIVLLISGAIGNFIDRCVNDYVVDFFYFRLIDFPIFNVADIYVTIGVLLMILLSCFYYKEEDFDIIFSTFSLRKKKELH